MTINEFCKYWREQHGLTQRQIADSVGAHYTQVSSFERGRNRSGKILIGYIINGLSAPKGAVTYNEEEEAKAYSETEARTEGT